jgi:hypothetical protein
MRQDYEKAIRDLLENYGLDCAGTINIDEAIKGLKKLCDEAYEDGQDACCGSGKGS